MSTITFPASRAQCSLLERISYHIVWTVDSGQCNTNIQVVLPKKNKNKNQVGTTVPHLYLLSLEVLLIWLPSTQDQDLVHISRDYIIIWQTVTFCVGTILYIPTLKIHVILIGKLSLSHVCIIFLNYSHLICINFNKTAIMIGELSF